MKVFIPLTAYEQQLCDRIAQAFADEANIDEVILLERMKICAFAYQNLANRKPLAVLDYFKRRLQERK